MEKIQNHAFVAELAVLTLRRSWVAKQMTTEHIDEMVDLEIQ